MARQDIEVRVVDKTSRALRNIETRIKGLNGGLLGINRVAALAAGAVAAIGGGNIISNIVNTTARFEDLRTTLASVAGGAREGAQAFDFISDFSTRTQFGIEELTTTFVKLKTAGIEPTEELLTTFTDAAAVTTDQLGSLQAITDLFARTTAGGLGLEEINRLTDRGIPALVILQEKLGLNRQQISEFGKSAEGARLITEALAQGINERFGGATQARVQNLSTRFSNLRIAINNASDAIGRQGFGLALGQVTEQITNYITKNEAAVKSIGLNLTKAFLIAVDAVKLVIANIEFLGKAFIAFFALKIGLAITGITISLARGLYPALLLAAKGVQFLTKAIRRNPLLAIGGAIAIGIAEATGALDKLFGALQDLGQEAIAGAGEKLVEGLEASAGAVGLNVDAIGEFKDGLESVNGRALELQNQMNAIEDSSNAVNDSLATTNETAGKTNEQFEEAKNAIGAQKKTFEEILADAVKQNEQAKIATEQNELIRQIKTAELELGRQLTDTEKEKLQLLFEQTKELQKQAERQAKIKLLADEALESTFGAVQQNINLITQAEADALNKLQDIYSSLPELQQEYKAQEQFIFDFFEDKKEQKVQEVQDKIDAIRQRGIERAIAGNKKLLAQTISAQDQLFLQRKGQEERTAEIVNNRIEFEKKSELGKTQFALEQGVTMFEGLSKVNKKFFAAQKAAAIALAIVNTYQGATKALATYPPPFNFIAAAATVASGLAQVATIRAQTMQRGGALPQGQAAIVGEDGPELIVPKQPSTVIPREVADAIDNMGGRGGDPVVVNFNITTVDAESFDTLLIRRRGTITSIINGALQKRGKEGVV